MSALFSAMRIAGLDGRAASLIAWLASAAACSGPPPVVSPPPTGPFTTGVPVFEANRWIAYVPGDAPLIIIVPHGGNVEPRSLRDRECADCLGGTDPQTQQLARAVVDSFVAHTGRRPHLVANLLRRIKLDANRDMAVATGGHANVESTWRWMHAAVDTAKASVVRHTGRGLVIDLHAHAHKIKRIEVGYLLDRNALRRMEGGHDTSASTVGSTMVSTIDHIARTSVTGDSYNAMHNGANSLGGMLAAAGLRAIPSPADPAPRSGEDYYYGVYNVERHGSLRGGTIDAVQLEMPVDAINDTRRGMERVAGQLARVLVQYLERHYAWK